MKFYKTLIALLLTATAIPAMAQHDMHMGHDTTKKDAPKKKALMMNSQYSRSIPMNRDGSGTSWMPDETPMYAYMFHGEKWMTMIHGNQYIRYNYQDAFKAGSRGGRKFDAPNMIMAMTQTKIGRNGLFSINTMFSLDPLTVGNGGYPLLFQTGESYKGQKLVDRQHPHDLFAQLSVAYTYRLNDDADVSFAFGYPSEPALGPPVFMHRLSGFNNPDAPLSHHYQDATHIAFGVSTLGFRFKNFKLEGSVFTGREPDEHRYDFDKPKFDSYSVRLSYNPTREWALQVSNGWLHSPEEAEPHENITRTTASAIHTKMLNNDSYIATTLVYGQNKHEGHAVEPSVLLESSLQWYRTAVYGRYEYVQKSADALNLLATLPSNPHMSINAITLGANYRIAEFGQTWITAGAQAAVNISPEPVRNIYGTAPTAIQVYFRINPMMMKMRAPR